MEKSRAATYTDFTAPGVILRRITVIQSALPGWQEVLTLVWEQQTSVCGIFPHPSTSEQPKMLPSDMQNAPYPAPSQWMAFYYAYMSEPEGALENIWNCGVCQKPFESSHKHGKSKHLAYFHLWVKLKSYKVSYKLQFYISTFKMKDSVMEYHTFFFCIFHVADEAWMQSLFSQL